MDKLKYLPLLKQALEQGKVLKELKTFTPKYTLWRENSKELLRDCFGEKAMIFEQSTVNMNMSEEQLYSEILNHELNSIQAFIKSLENDEVQRQVESLNNKISGYELHQNIKEVSYALYQDGHFASAVLEAFKCLINQVKDLSKSVSARDDYSMMGQVFTPDNECKIQFNQLSSKSEQDEQRGFMHFFQGIVMLRNLKGHENVIIKDSIRAYEYLVLASFLSKKLDERIKPVVRVQEGEYEDK